MSLSGIDVALRKRDRLRSARAERLGRQGEVGDTVGGLVSERYLTKGVLGRIHEVLAEDTRCGARCRTDDEHERLAEAAAHAVGRVLALDRLHGHDGVG